MNLASRLVLVLLTAVAAALPRCGSAQATASTHPLDPLTRPEIQTAVAVLKAAGKVSVSTRFPAVQLHEPAKAEVLSHQPGAPFRREAFAVLYDWSTNRTSEAVVDLRGRKLLSWREVPGAQPGLLEEDNLLTDQIVRADPRWQAAMRKRGIADLETVGVMGAPMGGYAPEQKDGSRLVIAVAAYRDPAPFGGFVEGVVAHVDLTHRRVLRVEDTGRTAPKVPPAALYDKNRLPPARRSRPLRITQPEGPGYQVRGHEVRWENWRFRFGMDPRVGLVLYTVDWTEGARARPVLYRGALSELLVPYGDPEWLFWNPFDAGEIGLGAYARSSHSGGDAPENATFFTSLVADQRGNPVETPRAIALWERDGGVLWRHDDESRRARQLVLSWWAKVDNYDYGFQWIFHQDGTLEAEVLLTGLMNFKAVRRTHEEPGGHAAAGSHGHLVAPHVEAPNHQHFFNYRLDLDIDGADGNSAAEIDTVPAPEGARNPYGNGFVMVERPLRSELEARRPLSPATSRRWKLLNRSVRNGLGQPSGYLLLPGENSVPYASPNSFPRRKGGFINSHVWVTPYRAEERYAAGDYVNLGPPDDGLPKWTSADRPLENTDLVLWYTLGVTHLPRPEEWPVMPVHRAGFRMVPTGFFSRNPALDAPVR